MILDQMLSQLTSERSRIQAELQKLERAIDSLEDLKVAQSERGIAGGTTPNVVGMQAG